MDGGAAAAERKEAGIRVSNASHGLFALGRMAVSGDGWETGTDLLVSVFGDKGRHARASVGVASLPSGASVEIEMIVEIADR